MIDVIKEELFTVIKQPKIPAAQTISELAKSFVMSRKYYYPHENETNEMVNCFLNNWRITTLSTVDEDSDNLHELTLMVTEGHAELVIFKAIGHNISANKLGEWQLMVPRHIEQMIAQLPELVDQAHQQMINDHYSFCVEDSKQHKLNKSLEEILEISNDVLAKSIHPLQLQ